MTSISTAQPDVTLLLDLNGVIRNATLAGAISAEGVTDWLGKPWRDTVIDRGGDKVRRMVEDAKAGGVSAFRQVTQRFPSGLELPVEYTTLMLGGRAGLMAIGKSLHAVAELQSRLIAAQQAMERDHWKMREIETRYRLLFEATSEAVVLLHPSNTKIIEANPAALQALGPPRRHNQGIDNRDFLQEIAPPEREAFQAMLARAKEQGKAPGMLLHLGKDGAPWMVRAVPTLAEGGPLFLLQLAPVEGGKPATGTGRKRVVLNEIIDAAPDGFVVLDDTGVISQANKAFLDLVEVTSAESVVGESASRWLWRPGADLAVLLANLKRHHVVRLFSTTIHGELGTETDVEISVAETSEGEPRRLYMVVRDVGRRLQTPMDDRQLLTALAPVSEQLGKVPLRRVVDDTVGVVERQHIKAALEAAKGNRTVAAEILGLSRQSLYAKLKRYGLDQRSPVDAEDNA
jgi:transcriptional regulator PpsR